MLTLSKPLLDLTAADLMCRDVVTLPWDMSLRAAAHRLATANVSGAPVVDGAGRCIGVLSKSDLVRSLDEGAVGPRTEEAPADFCADWQVVDFEALPQDAVARYMSGDAITALPEAPVRELAKLMYAFRIHRVLITDAESRVV